MTLPIAPATKGKSQRSSAYFIDVAEPADPAVYVRLFGVRSLTPSETNSTAENTDWDDTDENGLTWTDQETISKGWGLEIGFSAKDYGTATFQQDPGQALLEANNGDTVVVRWYRRDGVGKVKEGTASVSWAETDNGGLLNATATLTGKGALDKSADAAGLVTTP